MIMVGGVIQESCKVGIRSPYHELVIWDTLFEVDFSAYFPYFIRKMILWLFNNAF
jgi:hypothetical protein